MILFAAAILLASTTRVALVDDVYRIPAGEWRYAPVLLLQRPAMVSADFREETGDGQTRVALMRKEDVERLRNGRPHGMLAVTAPGASGHLHAFVHTPGEYAIVVDNESDKPSAVRLSVWLDFGASRGPTVTSISPRRRLAVILISFAVFFGIVSWSARTLLRNIRAG
jgi:hypothetical protein